MTVTDERCPVTPSSDQCSGVDGGRLWRAVLVAGVAASCLFVLAPAGSAYQLAAWSVPFVLATVLLAARVTRTPAHARGPLYLLLAGELLYVGASGVWYVAPVHFGVVLPFPSPLDVVFFAAYALYAAFLVVVLRRRAENGGLDRRLALADAAILTLALTAVLWVAVIEPNLTNGTPALPTAVAVLYPAVQLLLFALATHLVLSVGVARKGPAALLFLWIGGELAGDVFYGVQSASGTFSYSGPLVPLWMLAYTGLAAFAVHPGAVAFLGRTALPPSRAGRVRRRGSSSVWRWVRLGVLLLAAVVPLALAGLTTGQDPALMAIAAATFSVALYRASLLAGDLVEQRRLGAELDGALTQVRDQHEELARLAIVVESTTDAVVTSTPEGVVLTWNRGAELLYGYSRQEAVGRNFSSFLPVEDRQSFHLNAALLVEQGHRTVERVIVRKDGSPVEVETTLSVFYDDRGETVVGISRDVTERNRLQRELAAHAQRLDEAQRVAGVGSWEWDVRTGTVTVSVQLRRLFGLDDDADGAALSPALLLDRVHPEDRSSVEQTMQRSDVVDLQTRIVRRDGQVRCVAVRGELVRDADGRLVRKAGTVQDVTERVHLQQELARRVDQLDEAQRLAGVGSFSRDLVTGRDVWSSEYCRILGVDEGVEATYAMYLDRLHPEDRSWVQKLVSLHQPGEPLEYKARILRPDGQLRWIAVRGELHAGPDGRAMRKTGTAQDITERKLAEAELERLALTDALTGLANRDRFTRLLQSALSRPGGKPVGLLLLDLDGFKDVNDGIGHHAGDLVLQEVARRVSAVLSGGEHLARLGGDEFAVVLPDVAEVDQAIAVAARLRRCLEPAFDLDGITVHVGGSIGIAVSAEHLDPGALLKQADVAMYRAKTLSSGWAVFEPDQDDMAAGRLQMVTDLRATIARGGLDVAYQPVLDTATRRVSSFEALVRWTHPSKGVIPPDQFVPLAEQADLIVPLTRLVLRTAAAACVRWRSAGHDLRVAVNLSVQVMQNTDACALVAQALSDAGLAPEHLILEITEGSLATDADRVRPTLAALHELGVTLSIDDFGTGYSAMSYLKELPVAELKIDRSFVRDIASDTRDLAIVRSLVRLAHSLSLRVVAEGVETKPALEVLTALGCDFAQGYGIARPMPEADTAGWLARYPVFSATRVTDREPTDLLIVDDSSVVRAHLTHLAHQAGWQVRTAASAEQALLEVERSIPEVVILDHHMSGMSGMDSVPELRARGLDGPILLFTQFLSDAIPKQRMPLDVWPVSKNNPDAVLELLEGYRASGQPSRARSGS